MRREGGVDATLARGSFLVERLTAWPFFRLLHHLPPPDRVAIGGDRLPGDRGLEEANDMVAARSNWLDRPAPALE